MYCKSTSSLTRDLLPSYSLVKIFLLFLIRGVLASYPVHLTLQRFVTLILFGEQYQLWLFTITLYPAAQSSLCVWIAKLKPKLSLILNLASQELAFLSFVSFLWRCGPTRAMASSFLRFLHHTQRRTTVGRTPLDEWSARRRDLYLTTHNTHNRRTSMPPVGFEPTISASEWPQTYALDRAATGTGFSLIQYGLFTSTESHVSERGWCFLGCNYRTFSIFYSCRFIKTSCFHQVFGSSLFFSSSAVMSCRVTKVVLEGAVGSFPFVA